MTAQEYIHNLGRFSGEAGLHRIRALLSALGNPQQKLRFVHLAGTNGKGSTAAMIAEITQAAGYRVGLFTSPYLVEFNERIRVNGALISYEPLERLTAQVRMAAEGLQLPPGEHIGEFEFVTAVGLLYFVEQTCELVVLETGLGGEFDATNIIDAPLVTVITRVSLDHTAVLGDTIEEIARAKAGIIKAGSIVVSAPNQTAGAMTVLHEACYRQGVSMHVPGGARAVQCNLDGCTFTYESQEYSLSLIGRHQITNALTALHAVLGLRRAGFAISPDALHQGLARVRVPGRMERISFEPMLLLDGAHNPDGAEALAAAIDELLPKRQLLIIMGMMADKDIAPCVHTLAARADHFFAVAPDNDRALSAAQLASIARQDCARVAVADTLAQALDNARAIAERDACILVCGSLYLVGECEKLLQN